MTDQYKLILDYPGEIGIKDTVSGDVIVQKVTQNNNTIGFCSGVVGLLNEKSELINDLVGIDKETKLEIEHINNIYKELGFDGVIEYARDKLACFGAVREVEEGLYLMATGGWSDNEFWLDCLNSWACIFSSKHLRAITPGGGYYYSEEPYADIVIRLEKGKELSE